MKIQDLVNATVYTPAPPTERSPIRTTSSTGAAGTFITPQSLVSFPFAAGLVTGLWKGAQVLLPRVGTSPWIVLLIAFLVGGLICVISLSDERLHLTGRQKVVAIGIASLNCFYLFLAALGIGLK